MDLTNTLQALGSNEINTREAALNRLSKVLCTQEPIVKEGLEKRFTKYKQVWNCLFYCKINNII